MIDIHATNGTFGDVEKFATVRPDGQAAFIVTYKNRLNSGR